MASKGFLGGMMGLGSGLSKFSEALGEKRKMDWQSKEAALANQRALVLESLRRQNNMEVAKYSSDLRMEEYKSQKGVDQGYLEQNREAELDMFKKEQSILEGRTKRESAFSTDENIRQAKELTAEQKKLRDNQFAEFTQTEVYQNLTPTQQRTVEMISKAPAGVADALLKESRTGKFTAKDLEAVQGILENDEKFLEASPIEKLTMSIDAAALVSSARTGKGLASGVDSDIIVKIQQDMLAGKITKEDIDNMPEGEYKRIAYGMSKLSKAQLKNPGRLISVVVDNSPTKETQARKERFSVVEPWERAQDRAPTREEESGPGFIGQAWNRLTSDSNKNKEYIRNKE